MLEECTACGRDIPTPNPNASGNALSSPMVGSLLSDSFFKSREARPLLAIHVFSVMYVLINLYTGIVEVDFPHALEQTILRSVEGGFSSSVKN
jgi:hypothetical protein